MATARDIIESSMRLIGVLATGESAEASEASDGLQTLNDLLASWSTENMMVNSVVRESFPLVSSQASYTMGTGGDFNTDRPIEILTALLQETGASPTFELPMKILTAKQFSGITVKDITTDLPYVIYPEPTFPLMTLNIYPVPSAVKNLILYSLKPLTSFTNLSTSASFPPGYDRAFKYNLAVEIAPEFGVQASPTVMEIALESKANIKRQNMRPQMMGTDEGLRRQGAYWNWYTGENT